MHDTKLQSGSAITDEKVDPPPGALEEPVERVFLSPRVVDAAAYAEFAESLRHLLTDAAQRHESLGQAVRETEGVVEQLRTIATQAGKKLNPAVKLIPTIDQKLKQAEEALERANATMTSLEHDNKTRLDEAAARARTAIDALVCELERKTEAASARLAAMLEERDAAASMAMGQAIEIATTEARSDEIEEVETRVARALERADAAAAMAEAAEQQAEAAEARLAAAEAQLRAIDQRGREIADGASRALAMFDEELASRMRKMHEAMEQIRDAPVVCAAQSGPVADMTNGEDPLAAEVKPGRVVGKSRGAGAPGYVRIDRPLA